MNAHVISANTDVASLLKKSLEQLGIPCQIRHAQWQTEMPTGDADGAIAILAIEQHDELLSTLRRLRRENYAKLIIVDEQRDPLRLIELVREGADDFIDTTGNLHMQLAASVKRLRSGIKDVKQLNGRVTAVVSPSGGSGASVIAQNLAVSIAQRSKACALLDLDIYKGDQATLLNLKPLHTIADLCQSVDAIEGEMLEQCLIRHDSGLKLLAAPARTEDCTTISNSIVRRIALLARQKFPHVVVDLPACSEQRAPEILQDCDCILIVFRPDITSIKNLNSFLERWEGEAGWTDQAKLVANRWDSPFSFSLRDLQKVVGRAISYRIVDEQNVLQSVNCGNPVVTEWPSSPFAKSVREIADEEMGIAGSPNNGIRKFFAMLPEKVRGTASRVLQFEGLPGSPVVCER